MGILVVALLIAGLLLPFTFVQFFNFLIHRSTAATVWAIWVILIAIVGLGWVAQRLFNLSDRAAQGASGEEQVGTALESLRALGWHVFHDLPLVRVGNIDHLLIGPPGIFIVETKSHRGRITCSGTQLLRNGKVLEKDFIRQVKAQSAALNRLLQQQLRQNRYIQPIVCFSQALVQIPGNRVENVWVLPLQWLLPTLQRQPARLQPIQIQQLSACIAVLFGRMKP